MADWSDELAGSLNAYDKTVAKAVSDELKKAAAKANSEIKRHIDFKQRTGKYVRSFAVTATQKDIYGNNCVYVWHVKGAESRLTHLLENGHKSKNGRKVKAYPHIKYGDELINKTLEDEISKAIGGT